MSEAPALAPAGDFADWWAWQRDAHRFTVRRVPFAELAEWEFDPATGNLGHRSGRFFTVCGVRAGEEVRPIIHQPEIGVLGILVRRIGGVTHCLLQAKMEPGNVNTVQLSPTVQATRSNYTRVHNGSPVRYLVNTDARTVFACLLARDAPSPAPALLNWFTDAKARHDRSLALVGLPTEAGLARL